MRWRPGCCPGKQAGEAEQAAAFPAFAAFDQQDFAEWVDDERARARMRNDDVTLVRAKV